MKCTFSPSDAESSLEWESSDTKHATVDGNGRVKGVGEGSATIKARTVNGKEAKVKVKAYDSTKPTGVKLSASAKNGKDGDRTILYLNEGIQMTAKLSPSTAVTDLEWKSTNTKRGTVNSSGWVKAIGEGDFEIEVKTTRESKKDKIKFKVVDKPRKIKMTYAPDIKVGETVKFKVEIEPVGTSAKLTWSSSDNSIATVDSNGNVHGKKKGTVKIKVSTDNGKDTTEKIKVK